MGTKLEDFTTKKENDAIKIYIDGEQAFDVTRNYKIVTPSSALAPTYITYGNKSELRASCFMQPVGTFTVSGKSERIYEQDIVDFESVLGGKTYRNAGAIVYCPECFGWKIKVLEDGTLFNIEDSTIIKVLGSIYEHKAFAGCTMEIIYKLLGMQIPQQQKYAMLDEEIPFKTPKKKEPKAEETQEDAVKVYVNISKQSDNTVSWSYRLEYKGSIKSDSRSFKKAVDRKEYYMVAGTIIALSKLKRPAPIKLYTSMPEFAEVINKKQIKTLANSPWIDKATGESLDNMATLRELKGHIDRLGGNINAVTIESDGKVS